MRGPGNRAFHGSGVTGLPVKGDIVRGLFMNRVAARSQIQLGSKFLHVGKDAFGGILRLHKRFGHDNGDRVAHEPNLAFRQDRTTRFGWSRAVAVRDNFRPKRVGHAHCREVVAGHRQNHARHPACLFNVHGGQVPMRHLRSHEDRMERVIWSDVIDIPACPGQKSPVLEPSNRFATCQTCPSNFPNCPSANPSLVSTGVQRPNARISQRRQTPLGRTSAASKRNRKFPFAGVRTDQDPHRPFPRRNAALKGAPNGRTDAMDKTFDAHEAEARIYAAWESAGAFRAGANARPGAEPFCIMIPPPNVTGVLHMGHAFNNTLQDILVRWHRMRGFDTLWQPGQDHAGIATQMVVERMLAETGQPSRREMGREAFTGKVWEWKEESGGTIIEQLKRLGASCDWSRNAFTMSGAPDAPASEEGNFHDAVIRAFVKMHEDGLIYRGKRLVNWDPHFETAISDLEVENIEVDGHMWHFKYPLAGNATYEYVEKDEDGNVTLRESRDYISIATTRPETMLGDGAVAVHPSDERYAPIVGKLCEIPVGPKDHRRLIPIITDPVPGSRVRLRRGQDHRGP